MRLKATNQPDASLTYAGAPSNIHLPEDEHGAFWYVRKNLKTGNETREKFTPIQSPVFGDSRFVSRAALKQAMDDCIRSWNRQMPDTYHYRLADIPAKES